MSGYYACRLMATPAPTLNGDDLSQAVLHAAVNACRRRGRKILATVITDDPRQMSRRLQAIVALRDANPSSTNGLRAFT